MSSETFTLPSGASVTLRDPKSLRHKDRKRIYEQTNGLDGVMRQMAIIEGTIAVLVESWTLPYSLPNFNIDVLGELEIADVDFLSDKAEEYTPVLFPQVEEAKGTTPSDASPFPKSSD